MLQKHGLCKESFDVPQTRSYIGPKEGGCYYLAEDVDAILNSAQQLKAEILPLLAEASESLRIGDIDDGERIINEVTAKLSAV